ncbi:WGR domain-containing protein [Vibrio splendidus]|nr:WGR domain-containing protein [Vibrio splendidus]MCC4880365.1 WGR domain-containing protein [Vibrio splendidus]
MIVLVKTDLDKNNNKFWKAWVDGSNFCVHNGRIGTNGQKQNPKNMGSTERAERELGNKACSKIRDGYRELDVIDQSSLVDSEFKPNDIIRKAAREQIRTSEPSIIFNLIDTLIEKNIHNIVSNTQIEYDAELGLFKTPLGFIDNNIIEQAEIILTKMVPHFEKEDYDSDEIKTMFCDYLMLIPQKAASKLAIETFFNSKEKIEKQFGLIDDLRSSFDQINDIKAKVNEEHREKIKDAPTPNLFNCELKLVEDKDVIAFVNDKFKSKQSSYHSSSNMEVARVFEVCIDHMTDGFDSNKMQEKKNVWTLWHGTRAGNVVSILKNGLIIPPANAGHCAGRMFGNGVYFSDNSTKSLNYSAGFWSGTKEYTCYMFLCDVAMGEYHVPSHSNSRLHNDGHDSVFAKAGESSVMNNEMIVYDLNQIKPRYLVEFK